MHEHISVLEAMSRKTDEKQIQKFKEAVEILPLTDANKYMVNASDFQVGNQRELKDHLPAF